MSLPVALAAGDDDSRPQAELMWPLGRNRGEMRGQICEKGTNRQGEQGGERITSRDRWGDMENNVSVTSLCFCVTT